MTAEAERVLQSRSADDYYGALAYAFAWAMGSSLILQEGVKVLLITLVSPQLLPQLTALEQTSFRECIRLSCRGGIGLLYFVLRML